jgi:hypothetical protein
VEDNPTMRVLAIETSESVGSVAALAAGSLLGELRLPPKQGSAQSLAPVLITLLDTVHWRPDDVELVAVTIGPGSFTGLRVGVTAAKTFAYAVKAQVLGIDTLETIAAGCPQEVETGSRLLAFASWTRSTGHRPRLRSVVWRPTASPTVTATIFGHSRPAISAGARPKRNGNRSGAATSNQRA